ncbi:ketohexokinase isoform X3 [Folsomia candida]|uniref:ketohexokinase isoform X3 n=1 Tax=Folsomia candida TaxID=158441 RepID=UPI001604A713|nr:ketohexokinase isoform X3 [Folsomia candida]
MTGKAVVVVVVGHLCVDDVYHVLKYPNEDSTVGSRTQHNRCTKQEWARGGNASNNSTVLACLNQPVEFFGTLANDHLLKFFTDDMTSLGIKYDNCPIIDGIARAPASVVICSEESGTRTIVHSKGDLPELTLDDFQAKINLAVTSWVHFEGRNETEVVKMIEKIHEYNNNAAKRVKHTIKNSGLKFSYKDVSITISVEVEKCRESLNTLLPLGHVVFVGKDFASWQGAKNCRDAVQLMQSKVSAGSLVICPWGEDGAAYGVGTGSQVTDNDDPSYAEIKKIDAFPPSQLIDSLVVQSPKYCFVVSPAMIEMEHLFNVIDKKVRAIHLLGRRYSV